MQGRYFTLEQALALLPRLTELLTALQEARRALQAQEQSVTERYQRRVRGNGHVQGGEELAQQQAEVAAGVEALKEQVAAIEALGCVLKDLTPGWSTSRPCATGARCTCAGAWASRRSPGGTIWTRVSRGASRCDPLWGPEPRGIIPRAVSRTAWLMVPAVRPGQLVAGRPFLLSPARLDGGIPRGGGVICGSTSSCSCSRRIFKRTV
jgi:hypothetical protein